GGGGTEPPPRGPPPGAARVDGAREPLLAELRLNLERWAAEPPRAVIDRWRSLSDPIGRRVRVDLPTGAIEGVADDIDDTGLLVVDGRAISAGSVTVLRGGGQPHELRQDLA